jgi:S1-C subfamily serine protease
MRTLAWIGVVVGIGMLAGSWPARAADPDDGNVRKSVVKILVTGSRPDPFHPWAKDQPQEMTSSGVVIEGRRILTLASMLLPGSQIYVQPDRSGEKLPASVAARAPGIDLAVLKLDDESFFETHPALPTHSKLPDLKQTVFTYGFPTGGSELSVTRGIVSRIEYSEYFLSVQGLRVQVDAAINPGNHGGPAVVDGRLIGLVWGRLNQADNIGYLIPTEEIHLFLEDIRDGRYDGKPVLDIYVQKMESETLRGRYKLDKKTTGVLVRKVYNADSSYPLHVGDVLTQIGDHRIDNAAGVQIEGNLRINSNVLVQRLARDGRLPVVVVRDGQEVKLDLPVGPMGPVLFPYAADRPLSYFIIGPVPFTEATGDYVDELVAMYTNGIGDDNDEGPNSGMLFALYQGNPMYSRYGDRPAFPGERIVIVPQAMFTHRISKGLEDPYGNAVAEVNGVRIRNLKHLVEVIRDATGEYLEITFQGRANDALVFRRREALDATEEILRDNSIRQPCSPDIAPIWNNGKKKVE